MQLQAVMFGITSKLRKCQAKSVRLLRRGLQPLGPSLVGASHELCCFHVVSSVATRFTTSAPPGRRHSCGRTYFRQTRQGPESFAAIARPNNGSRNNSSNNSNSIDSILITMIPSCTNSNSNKKKNSNNNNNNDIPDDATTLYTNSNNNNTNHNNDNDG